MQDIHRRFDAIVIGSGAGGSIAVKELTEYRKLQLERRILSSIA